MKIYGTVGQGEAETRVYVRRIVGNEVVLDSNPHARAGFAADGCVIVRHGRTIPGSADEFSGSIVDAARDFLLDNVIIRQYETVGGFTGYELV